MNKATASLLLVLCAAGPAPYTLADGKPVELAAHAQKYQQLFEQAALEFNVPVELLQAIAYAETRWHPHVPKGQAKNGAEPEVTVEPHGGMPPGYGIMGLHDDDYFGHSLGEAAALIGVAPAAMLTGTRANIRGAAALLAQYGARRTRAFPLEDWEGAVARYSGIAQREIADLYTYEVFAAIRQGRQSDQFKINQRRVDMEKIYGEDKLRKLSAHRIKVETGVPDPKISAPGFIDAAPASTDYPPALWRPAASCNYSARTAAISEVTIHTTEGSYAGTISWFQNCSAAVSAHYVIRSSDGQATQMVREADQAWHIGTSNGYTVGIEHEGYIADPGAWYTGAMYDASAALTRAILASRSLVLKVYDGSSGWNAVLPDAKFDVKGHVNFPSQTHADPGPGWDWARYQTLVANGTTSGGGSTTPLAWPLVQYGNTGERVRTAQYLLRQRGNSLTVDGSFGTGTLDAVRNFQALRGLPADGQVGNGTWAALTVVAQQGASGARVRAPQSQLVESGYGVAVDGVFGSGTDGAVRSFQGAAGLGMNGIVGDDTWNKMAR